MCAILTSILFIADTFQPRDLGSASDAEDSATKLHSNTDNSASTTGPPEGGTRGGQPNMLLVHPYPPVSHAFLTAWCCFLSDCLHFPFFYSLTQGVKQIPPVFCDNNGQDLLMLIPTVIP